MATAEPALDSVAFDQAAGCASCQHFEETCALRCSTLDVDQVTRERCLMSCAKVVSDCSPEDSIAPSSEFLVEMGYAKGPSALKASCNGIYTCPSEYASCAGWSSYADCGDPYCAADPLCGQPIGPALRQLRERYRVCFNASGQSCTEYHSSTYTVSCGC